jgi:Fur family transcriptional regulator, peroxide stress response regulator
MKRTADELKTMMAKFESAIRGAGIKMTPQRLEIFRQTAATTTHPDIETIHREVRKTMPGVSLDTVYRALALFAELGLVSTVQPQGHHIRFDANISPHHHFVCSNCGAALDFEDRDFDNLRIPKSASALGRVVSRHVELRGLCAPCAAGAAGARHSRSPRTIGTRSHHQYNKTTRRD